jgi:hypothetical protein
MATTILHTRDGKLDSSDETAFAALVGRIRTGSPDVLLHLHGGLVDQPSAEATAKRLSGAGPNAYNAPGDWEQVYIVWRTGGIETLKTNWRDLAKNDRLYNALLRKLLSFASGKISANATGGRSVGSEIGLTEAEISKRLSEERPFPFRDVDEIRPNAGGSRSQAFVNDGAENELELMLESDIELEIIAADIEASIAENYPLSARAGINGNPDQGREMLDRLALKPKAGLEAEAAQSASTRGIISFSVVKKIIKHAVIIGKRVFDRYRQRRDHGLHATIAEEIVRELYGDLIGSIVWGMMKGDAGDHFVTQGADEAKYGFGARLFTAIAANSQARLRIVGHSAGSIFASEMLLWAARAQVPMKADVAFLAPAVRCSKLAAAINASAGCINRFRLFAMSDQRERDDGVLGRTLSFIYPSSLLYLVSGLFEEEAAEGLCDSPLAGMQRFLIGPNSWLDDGEEGAALQTVRHFLEAKPNRMVFSPSKGDGIACDATSHGGFDDDPDTLRSIMTYLA